MTGLLGLALPPWLNPTLIGAVAIAVAAGAASGWAVHRIDDGRYQALVASQATAQAKAISLARQDEQARAKITYDHDVAAAKAGQQIVVHTQEVIRRVPVYVTQNADATCHLTVGFLRAINSAFFGTDIPTAASPTNDTDAGISLSEATKLISSNGGICRLSQDQSNQWRSWATDQLNKHNGP